MEVLKKKTELPYNLATPPLGIYPKEMKSVCLRDTDFHVHKSMAWKQPKYPLTVVHIHHGILHSFQKEEILSFVTTWIELEVITLCEISQVQKDSVFL
jgi:hypothetical protein